MISYILIILSSFFFLGIVNRVRAINSGRKGPGIFQVLRDLRRLFKKGSVYSTTTSYIFQIGPSIYFASVLTAMMVVPFDYEEAIFSFEGDFIFFAYVLGLGKFFLILSALDTGSPFEGMGANREALYSMLVEPAFFIIMGSFAMLTGYTSFHEIFNHVHDKFNSMEYATYFTYAMAVLAAYVFIQIAMVENSRLPIDDPKTHLELTMIHEVMILDHSGFDLGLIIYSTSLKFAMYGCIIANFFLIDDFPMWISIPVFFAVQIIFAMLVGMMESFRARSKMNANPQIIFTLSSISLLIFFAVLVLMNKFEI